MKTFSLAINRLLMRIVGGSPGGGDSWQWEDGNAILWEDGTEIQTE